MDQQIQALKNDRTLLQLGLKAACGLLDKWAHAKDDAVFRAEYKDSVQKVLIGAAYTEHFLNIRAEEEENKNEEESESDSEEIAEDIIQAVRKVFPNATFITM